MADNSPSGRPTIFTEALADSICERIAKGQSLHKLARLKCMPCEKTIYLWLASMPEFLQKYRLATERRADRFANEVVEIADSTPSDKDDIAKAKLRITARQWSAARLHPKKYGNTVQPEGDAEDPDELDDDNPTLG